MSQSYRLKLSRPALTLKVNTRIPARFEAESPLVLDKSTGVYNLSLNLDALQESLDGVYSFDAQSPTTTQGDIIYRDALTNARLGAGTSGYHLQTGGAGANPSWAGFLQAGTGAVTRTWQDKARDIVSVTDFGAVGDGVTDDTAAFIAAIAEAESGGISQLCAISGGVHIVKNLELPSGVSLDLRGAELRLPSTATSSDVLISLTGSAGNTIRGGTFTYASPATPDNLIYLANSTGTVIEDCKFPSPHKIAININQSTDVDLSRNYYGTSITRFPVVFISNATGFGQSNPKNINVTDSEFYGSGINISADGGRVSRNRFYPNNDGTENLGTGIIGFDDSLTPDSYVSRNIVIDGNIIEGILLNTTSDGDGMELEGSNYTISGNTVTNTATQGIVLYGGPATVVGNVISNVGLSGAATALCIQISAARRSISGFIVVGNTCSDDQTVPTTQHGVGLYNSGFAHKISNALISGNTSEGGIISQYAAVVTTNPSFQVVDTGVSIGFNVGGSTPDNVAYGPNAGLYATGTNNICIGANAGSTISSGSSNIMIGLVNPTNPTDSNKLNIGGLIFGDTSAASDGIISAKFNAATSVVTPSMVLNGLIVDTSAWTTYTPTAVCGQSTGTAVGTATGRYKELPGKVVAVEITIVISGTFTVGTLNSVTAPITAGSARSVLAGKETDTTGMVWSGTLFESTTTIVPNKYDGTNTITTGMKIVLSGTYERS